MRHQATDQPINEYQKSNNGSVVTMFRTFSRMIGVDPLGG